MADFTALKTAIQTYIKQNGNEEITGNILQEVLLSMVQTMGDGAINDLVTDLSDEVTARQNADTTLGNSLQAIHDAIDNGYVYAGIATPTGTPVSGKVFYFAVTAGTYTNFGGLTVTQGINILKYNGSTWGVEQVVGIDNEPTAGSNNLVKSGGVYNDLNGIVFFESFSVSSGNLYHEATGISGYNRLILRLSSIDSVVDKFNIYFYDINGTQLSKNYGSVPLNQDKLIAPPVEAVKLAVYRSDSAVVTAGNYKLEVRKENSDEKLATAVTTLNASIASVASNAASALGVQANSRLKKLWIETDSTFTNELTGIIDYYVQSDIDLTKEYYLKVCGYRENRKTSIIVQVYDENNTLIEQKQFDGSDNKVHKVVCAGFAFIIDIAALPQNSDGSYIGYNLHLNKYGLVPKEYGGKFTFEENTKIVCLGDSITQSVDTYDGKDYPSLMGHYFNAKVFNLGLGGTTFSINTDCGFCEVVDAILSGDYTDIDAWIANAIQEYPAFSYLTTRWNAFKAIDFSTVNALTIAYGTNDWNFGYALDNDQNPLDKTTILGALRYGVSRLFSEYPELRIYVYTPIYRWFTNDSETGEITSDSDTVRRGTANILLQDVADAIKEECDKLHIPCKNMYYCSGINKYNGVFMLRDGTHPDQYGAELLAEKFAKFIDSE